MGTHLSFSPAPRHLILLIKVLIEDDD
uniref:Uncharacterized protein n=1 Tax=Anguilla anguilla TaxID=7936 RepID=A0A0E9VM40_ANGAN